MGYGVALPTRSSRHMSAELGVVARAPSTVRRELALNVARSRP